MNIKDVDIAIVGAGPVGLMCAYLANLCGLSCYIADKSEGPLAVGRADALNARTLQYLEIAKLFDDVYSHGKPCNTSSVWSKGEFVSRQSRWWDELEGCFHKHFLMIGQAFIEQVVDSRLKKANLPVKRNASADQIRMTTEGTEILMSNGDAVRSRFLIGADGAHSMVRRSMDISFEITRPEIVWAVVDGVIETDFPKVPEIIVFQNETSDVAWIPRERNIDRFYVRMDRMDFTLEEAVSKIDQAILPHRLSFVEMEWFSRFSVKESVAEKFSVDRKVFLVGDACHVHSVNGGQGLNTGLADAFNLIWKMNMVVKNFAPEELLDSYEFERKPVAQSVVESSGELVRSTKYSKAGTHAKDYVEIVAKRAGNITGMGIRYGDQKSGDLVGERLFDFEIFPFASQATQTASRIYTQMDYSRYTLLLFGSCFDLPKLKSNINVIAIEIISPAAHEKLKRNADLKNLESLPNAECNASASNQFLAPLTRYEGQALIVRPDGYIAAYSSVTEIGKILEGYVYES
ncbi:MAG: FAD-binding protein [Proteobacteria bacterium]|nr:FAD-binding protein [Pseudomonadota bacterium]